MIQYPNNTKRYVLIVTIRDTEVNNICKIAKNTFGTQLMRMATPNWDELHLSAHFVHRNSMKLSMKLRPSNACKRRTHNCVHSRYFCLPELSSTSNSVIVIR